MPLGLYISVPFCRTKCSYCNFASRRILTCCFPALRGPASVLTSNVPILQQRLPAGFLNGPWNSIYLGEELPRY